MYDFERAAAADGDMFLNVQDTLRIGDVVYPLSPDADDALLSRLAEQGYRFDRAVPEAYIARKLHDPAPDEILDGVVGGMQAMPHGVVVDLRYAQGRRHSLAEPDIHETILTTAGQRPVMNWYNRDADFFDMQILSRMRAFAIRLVDGVTPDSWSEFEAYAKHLHARNFIMALAAMASAASDRSERFVRIDDHGATAPVSPVDRFPQLRRGGFYGPGL